MICPVSACWARGFDVKGRSATRWIVSIAVAALLFGIGGSVLAASSIPGVHEDEVTDPATGRPFLIQELEPLLPDRPSAVTGAFEYLRVPGNRVVEFQAQLEVVEPAWISNPPQGAIVLSWSSPDVTFQVPRPRPGVDATLRGDTFVIIVVPGQGRKITAVVSAEALAGVRQAGQDTAREPLTLAATN